MSDNRPLMIILAVLTVSVLLTGGLAIQLTLARAGVETGEIANEQATEQAAPNEPHIAFVSDLEESVGVYVMNTDGTNRRRVSGPDRSFYSNPSWAPDGRRLAYVGIQENPSTGEDDVDVWVATIDGSEQIHINQNISHTFAIQPAWSPDGTLLAFVAAGDPADEERRAVMHIARADGSGIERSIPLPWTTYEIAWSPAGDALLLVGAIPGEESSVWLLPLEHEGEGEEGLVELFEGALTADWSPDGEDIVVGDYSSNTVLIVSREGEPRPVTSTTLDPVEVAWSPDGAHIAVATAASTQQGYGNNLYLVTAEAGEVTTVLENEGWVVWPRWSPDGSHLLFTSGPMIRRTGSDLPYADLYAYDVASGASEQLTMGGGFEGLGVWSP